MIIYLFHPLFRLFGILILNIKDTNYCVLVLFSIFMCLPIIWLVRRSRILRLLITGDNSQGLFYNRHNKNQNFIN
ncbi:MAG: hypothetical protein QG646_792 [Euryarchaeota archaeon]|nr:hypothetical protein [Euryarchaeota archaeon]